MAIEWVNVLGQLYPMRKTEGETGLRIKAGSEAAEAAALICWAEQYPEIRRHLFAIENGGSRTKSDARRLRLQGVTPGVSDYFYAYPAQGKHGFFIELKRPALFSKRAGRPTIAQLHFLAEKSVLGYQTMIAVGWVQAANALIEYRSDLGIKKING